VFHSASNGPASEAASGALCEVARHAASCTVNNGATAGGGISVAGGSAIISATTINSSQVEFDQ